MATIRDVAKRAGVAICTVSRMLNDSSYVADETRKRIEAAIIELNYVPNELARGMFRKKSGIVAMLVPGIQHLYFSTLANCIEQELRTWGYRLMLCSTGDNLEREREQMQFLRSNMVDGIISGVGSLDEREYKAFDKPIVMLDHDLPDIPFVVSDHRQGGRIMAEFFIAQGRKRVVHLIGEHRGRPALSQIRHDTFGTVLRESGIKSRLLSLEWTEMDFYSYLEMAESMLRRQPEIDGVMAADIPAAAFLKVALESGRKVPKDFTVVACDGTYVVSSNMIEITSIVQDLPEIARRSVDLLVRMIDGETPNERENIVPVLVHRGETA